MTEPVRLAIVGSTKFHGDAPARLWASGVILDFLNDYDPEVVISGGAKGIDRLAKRIAEDEGYTTIEHLPLHPRWEPLGYKERNERIARDCTHLLCIRHHASTTYGSGWTADFAEALGKEVVRVTYRGEE